MASEQSSNIVSRDERSFEPNFPALPPHIQVKIFGELGAAGKTINSCRLVCKRWKRAIDAHRGRELPIRETSATLQFTLTARLAEFSSSNMETIIVLHLSASHNLADGPVDLADLNPPDMVSYAASDEDGVVESKTMRTRRAGAKSGPLADVSCCQDLRVSGKQ